MMLRGKVALVTGASRGIGRGIALQLGEAGATVYITGRQVEKSDGHDGKLPSLENTAHEITQKGGKGVAVYCDHTDSDAVKKLFQQIEQETDGQLDILVNNAYSAVNALIKNMGKKFWELEPEFWDSVNNVGLRNHYICSVYAARMMVERSEGLIVTVSSMGGLHYLFNTAYGVGKAACDRLAADMAHELQGYNVASVSLWPGLVKTEMFKSSLDNSTDEQLQEKSNADSGFDISKLKENFDSGESTEYSGRCIVHLATDANIMKKSGRVLVTADLGDEYGFTDIDGRKPPNLRSVQSALKFYKWESLAAWVPPWIKIPGWIMAMGSSRL